MRRVNKILVTAFCLAAVPIPALADTPNATGSGSAGAVDLTTGGQITHQDPIAPCAVGTTATSSSSPLVVGTRTRFGSATTSCKRNADSTASVSVSGERFETTVLAPYGGPAIKVKTFKASCDTTENGSRGQIQLGGVSGVSVPSNIPANYTVTIPGPTPSSPPIAAVVLNELITPNPPDGSLTSHPVHIRLFPQGGPASGDIFVGTVACNPDEW
ncbi:MAG TPA: choice-of-anchor P family protein [Amycolatopsis sp.]|uniref:choice-of-anchor P family protein n=1 Tax=Amycolatopsis sp. TaxID=37632 RepID=UPI002B49352E|nr:choice-of-anchor P family protein [Amycolatopsis sp.]HKS47270.1 choice-of-anchor P family protein [Amycolatopsis sp.]